MEIINSIGELNKYQTPITTELIDGLTKYERDQLTEYITSVPYIKYLISSDKVRGYARDRERDSSNRIKVDISKPHILEDMDFFRERAIYFTEHGTYTKLKPNPNPKSEYRMFWREEMRRWEHGLIRPSDGEWIPGPLYYYWNYVQIAIVKKIKGTKKAKRIKGFPRVYLGDYLFYHYCDQAQNRGSHGKCLKARGVGMEQPHSELVVTPDGWKKVGEIKENDYLVDNYGSPTKVLEVLPQGIKDVYEVGLIDGRKVLCGKSHLWLVHESLKRGKERVLTTGKMIEEGLQKEFKAHNTWKFKIPRIKPVEFKEKDLPIPPYTLGYMLGDGTMNHGTPKVATDDVEVLDFIQEDLGDSYIITPDESNNNYLISYKYRFNHNEHSNKKYENSQYGINPLIREIENLKLNVNSFGKFIPEIYKQGSVNQRFELLRGLMDSDGSINVSGKSEFTNSNLRLLEDVAELCRSLGIRCTVGKGRPPRKKVIKGKECNTKQEYRLYISTNESIFKIYRKKDREIYDKPIYKDTPITSIKKLDYKEESTCFIVDNPKHVYLTKDYTLTHNSFKFAAMSPHNMYTKKGSENPNFHLASDKSFLLGDKGIWGKILDNLDFLAKHTPLPKIRMIDKKQGMEIQLGYEDEFGVRRGLLTSVFGISLKDNPDKARGIRGPLIHYEEDGLFPNLEKAWNVNREATEEDGVAYGFMFAAGTGGVSGSSFEGSEKLFYKPNAYNIYGIPNLYDKNTTGATVCGFFWGAYLNRGESVTKENGEPDVIAGILNTLEERVKIIDNASDPLAITQKKAESPLTPQEAVMRVAGTIFPVSDLKDYLESIYPTYDKMQSSHYIGDLFISNNKVIWKPDANKFPIRDYQINGSSEGAIEIFEKPKYDANGNIDSYRYCAGVDPVDDDSGTSLCSIFIFDLFTDRIVAEFTGRPRFADEFYEICRKLLMFYNARANYENNKKGMYSYFSRKNSVHLLVETPQILRDVDLVKTTGYGNKAVGTNATKGVNMWARRLIRDWLLSPAYEQYSNEDGSEVVKSLNMHKIRGKALLDELIAWNEDGNFDRVSALGMVMIIRADSLKYIDSNRKGESGSGSDSSEDEYFNIGDSHKEDDFMEN